MRHLLIIIGIILIMFGINIPGVTWNSWYNPLDNTAKLLPQKPKSAFETQGGASVGGGGGGGTGFTGGAVNPNNPYGVDLNQSYGGAGVLVNGGASGGSSGGSGGSGGGSAAPAVDPQALLQYDNQINQYNDALARLDRQQGIGASNIENQYNQSFNKLTGQRDLSRRDYSTNKDQQLQDYQSARTNVQDNTRNVLLNTRRLLGGQGAGGGSADRYAAPAAAQTLGASGTAKVQQTNARNIASLDTAYGDNEKQFETSFADLLSQKESGLRGNQSNFEQQRSNILGSIADLVGKKSMAQGKTYEQALAETNPYTQRINGILSTIDSLAANPGVVRANDVTLAKPNLSAYEWNRFNAPATIQQDTSLTPNIRALLGLDQEQQRLTY